MSRQAIQPSCGPLDCSSSSLRTRSTLSQRCFTLDPPDDISLDIDLDQRTASSTTLLSRRVSSLSMIPFSDASDASFGSFSTRPSESSPSCFLYPLHEPGQRTAQRTQRLRARTAAVIMSIPATCEDVIDPDEDEPSRAIQVSSVSQAPKLRRVPGIGDLRRAFRDADDAPAHSASIPSLEPSKAAYELGIIVYSTSPLSSLSPRSSLRTLVGTGSAMSYKSGDAKMPSDPIIRSISSSSRLTARLYSTFSPSRTQHTPTTDTSQSTKYPIHTLSISRTRRHASLHLDARLSRSPGERVWSCAKISQSVAKRAARGGTPRRVFSHPNGLSP